MSNATLAFCFGVHNHQPFGNFDDIIRAATVRAYHPLFERLHARPEVRLTVHCTGGLLEWLRERAAPTFDLLGRLVAEGQVELLTGGFYEPILAILPDHDKLGQIELLTEFLIANFGVRPRGMWLAERVWEPHLPKALRAAGVEYVLVDDAHFALAGLDPDALGGYYLTEEQGAVLGVFPINQRLRYLIPFADVEATIEYLAERREGVRALTMMDDGEKFGVWPGTHAHVYEDGWLDRFFDRILGTPWIVMSTFGDVLDRIPASGRVYLPTASYREMGEWALPVAESRALAEARRALEPLADGARWAGRLRGGFWRSFLVKYPEVADWYWKMLRLSRSIEAARVRDPGNGDLGDARRALWRGQANDAYWHGVFGGCYLPHLRRAVKSSLLEAERRLAGATGAPAVSWSLGDGNADGLQEILVRTRDLAVTLNPDAGGVITEIGYLPRALDVGDVLTRRPEAYHDQIRLGRAQPAPPTVATIHAPAVPKEADLEALLAYDPLRRACLVDVVLEPGQTVDPIAPWNGGRLILAGARRPPLVEEIAGGVAVTMSLDPEPPGSLVLDKRVIIREASVDARYRLRPRDGRPVAGQWLVQWNLVLTAGDAPGRYLSLPGQPSLGSTGRVPTVSEVALIDEWVGVEARLRFRPAAALSWGPVQTVSLSEGGFERIYQGTALAVAWPFDLGPPDECELSAELTVASR